MPCLCSFPLVINDRVYRRFLNYLCRNGQTVPCLPSKRFNEFYRLYRSLRDRNLSTVVGGQCVANKHVKVPFTRTLRCFRLDSIAIRWSWGYMLYPILQSIAHRYITCAFRTCIVAATASDINWSMESSRGPVYGIAMEINRTVVPY